jgi:hypothetical protein
MSICRTPNIQFATTLHKSLPQTDYCSQSQSFLLRLVTSSNSGRSSAPRLMSSQAGGHLHPTSYSSNFRLRTAPQCKLFLVLQHGTDSPETHLPIVSPLFLVIQPLPSNGSFCLFGFCFEQYSTVHTRVALTVVSSVSSYEHGNKQIFNIVDENGKE